MRKRAAPRVGRPLMPKEYGVPKGRKGLQRWERAARRLARAHNYWVVTAGRGGRPHAVPVWAVWVEGALCFGTDRSSRKAKNLARNRALVIHLESGDDTLIVSGRAVEVKRRAQLARLDAAYEAKYRMRLSDAPGELVVYALRPKTALAWRERDFPKGATRWTFA